MISIFYVFLQKNVLQSRSIFLQPVRSPPYQHVRMSDTRPWPISCLGEQIFSNQRFNSVLFPAHRQSSRRIWRLWDSSSSTPQFSLECDNVDQFSVVVDLDDVLCSQDQNKFGSSRHKNGVRRFDLHIIGHSRCWFLIYKFQFGSNLYWNSIRFEWLINWWEWRNTICQSGMWRNFFWC